MRFIYIECISVMFMVPRVQCNTLNVVYNVYNMHNVEMKWIRGELLFLTNDLLYILIVCATMMLLLLSLVLKFQLVYCVL